MITWDDIQRSWFSKKDRIDEDKEEDFDEGYLERIGAFDNPKAKRIRGSDVTTIRDEVQHQMTFIQRRFEVGEVYRPMVPFEPVLEHLNNLKRYRSIADYTFSLNERETFRIDYRGHSFRQAAPGPVEGEMTITYPDGFKRTLMIEVDGNMITNAILVQTEHDRSLREAMNYHDVGLI